MSAIDVESDLAALRRRLCAQAELFDRPDIYVSGVMDAFDAIDALLRDDDVAEVA